MIQGPRGVKWHVEWREDREQWAIWEHNTLIAYIPRRYPDDQVEASLARMIVDDHNARISDGEIGNVTHSG